MQRVHVRVRGAWGEVGSALGALRLSKPGEPSEARLPMPNFFGFGLNEVLIGGRPGVENFAASSASAQVLVSRGVTAQVSQHRFS